MPQEESPEDALEGIWGAGLAITAVFWRGSYGNHLPLIRA